MNPGTLPPAFQALETRLVDLRRRYGNGEIDATAYQAGVQELKAQDPSGTTWWLGGESGAWHYWDGSAWVRGDPGVTAGPPHPAVKPRRSIRPFAIGCGVGVLLVALLTTAFLVAGWQAYQQEPKIVEVLEPDPVYLTTYTLSADQRRVVDQQGYPEAFVILFYEEEQVGGSFVDVRFETWSYYTAGLEYTFVNGVQEAEDSLDIVLEGEILPIPYRPDQFVAYMSLDEVIASAGLETYLVVPLEKELVEGGEVYYGDELTFGLKDNELMYLEALALEVEG